MIWLLEVKDPADVFVVPEIRRHLDRFYVTRGKDKAYAEQLGAKHKDLSPDAVAAALGLPVAEGSAYEIRPIFVTRRPVPAAFVDGAPTSGLPQVNATGSEQSRWDVNRTNLKGAKRSSPGGAGTSSQSQARENASA